MEGFRTCFQGAGDLRPYGAARESPWERAYGRSGRGREQVSAVDVGESELPSLVPRQPLESRFMAIAETL
jgi:hypothetical protein